MSKQAEFFVGTYARGGRLLVRRIGDKDEQRINGRCRSGRPNLAAAPMLCHRDCDRFGMDIVLRSRGRT
jgi:hypothetical protein